MDQDSNFSWVMSESEEGLPPLVPPGLTIDTYDGRAWLTLNAFNMAAARFRGM
jgi:uncharacterized protein YqjF (DUF2071 family)